MCESNAPILRGAHNFISCSSSGVYNSDDFETQIEIDNTNTVTTDNNLKQLYQNQQPETNVGPCSKSQSDELSDSYNQPSKVINKLNLNENTTHQNQIEEPQSMNKKEQNICTAQIVTATFGGEQKFFQNNCQTDIRKRDAQETLITETSVSKFQFEDQFEDHNSKIKLELSKNIYETPTTNVSQFLKKRNLINQAPSGQTKLVDQADNGSKTLSKYLKPMNLSSSASNKQISNGNIKSLIASSQGTLLSTQFNQLSHLKETQNIFEKGLSYTECGNDFKIISNSNIKDEIDILKQHQQVAKQSNNYDYCNQVDQANANYKSDVSISMPAKNTKVKRRLAQMQQKKYNLGLQGFLSNNGRDQSNPIRDSSLDQDQDVKKQLLVQTNGCNSAGNFLKKHNCEVLNQQIRPNRGQTLDQQSQNLRVQNHQNSNQIDRLLNDKSIEKFQIKPYQIGELPAVKYQAPSSSLKSSNMGKTPYKIQNNQKGQSSSVNQICQPSTSKKTNEKVLQELIIVPKQGSIRASDNKFRKRQERSDQISKENKFLKNTSKIGKRQMSGGDITGSRRFDQGRVTVIGGDSGINSGQILLHHHQLVQPSVANSHQQINYERHSNTDKVHSSRYKNNNFWQSKHFNNSRVSTSQSNSHKLTHIANDSQIQPHLRTENRESSQYSEFRSSNNKSVNLNEQPSGLKSYQEQPYYQQYQVNQHVTWAHSSKQSNQHNQVVRPNSKQQTGYNQNDEPKMFSKMNTNIFIQDSQQNCNHRSNCKQLTDSKLQGDASKITIVGLNSTINLQPGVGQDEGARGSQKSNFSSCYRAHESNTSYGTRPHRGNLNQNQEPFTFLNSVQYSEQKKFDSRRKSQGADDVTQKIRVLKTAVSGPVVGTNDLIANSSILLPNFRI